MPDEVAAGLTQELVERSSCNAVVVSAVFSVVVEADRDVLADAAFEPSFCSSCQGGRQVAGAVVLELKHHYTLATNMLIYKAIAPFDLLSKPALAVAREEGVVALAEASPHCRIAKGREVGKKHTF